MNSEFRQRLLNGDVLVGTIITIPSPEIAEIMAEVGFDYLWIDTEHSPFNARGAQSVLQAADSRCPCVIRIPGIDDVWIKKALDTGATGIIAPQVKTAAEAEAIVRMCKYPPQGTRGVGIGRAHKYGLRFQEYMQNANENVAVILQAETTDAVTNIADIVKVAGVDAIFIGPYDLSASLGKMGELSDPEVQKAITTITEHCENAGVRLGIFADTAESAQTFIQKGFNFIVISTDGLLMARAAKTILSDLKE
ncbi:MAG: aldolase/citrate lyase family protein [Desulfobacterales bacterium]|jgi:2-dehydro-3-deoxyglucarate aldolase/4-hydroxy-2-oxoheptanedioate aldolase